MPPAARFNANLKHTPPLDEPRLAMAIGVDMEPRISTDVVVNGLWHCLLGSLAAGLAVSTVLGALVLVLSQMG
ncbi:MAG: hypothetical protein QNL90_06870 [Gammaproteobacteria bacterium]|nr:hypothetical protein [Gammaproteobacteria bacterium]MDX2459851.1 hypothetical protein [Gammaproteobacteria bacterium]